MSDKKSVKGINDAKHKDLKTAIKKIEKLPEVTKLGLIYNPKIGIPYTTATKLVGMIEKYMPNNKYIFAGSYLRESPIVNDIDIVYWGKPDLLLAALATPEFIITSRGATKITCIFLNSVTNCYIDIWFATPENKIPMILYVTGSRQFNIIMRMKAKKLGYLLNQDGLYKGDKLVPLKKEKDYFDIIEMNYLTPKQRDFGATQSKK